MTIALRRSLCRWLIALVILSQWTAAAYACPLISQALRVPSATAGVAPMERSHCDQQQQTLRADPQLPHLCAEHCHPGQQNHETHTPAVPLATPVSAYVVVAAVSGPLDGLPPGERRYAQGAWPMSGVPHAIRFCCLRI